MAMIAVNGFYVAGEFALVAVNRNRVDARAAEGDGRAARLAGRLRELSFELSGAQLGITVSSLVVGTVAEPSVAALLSPVLGGIGLDSPGVSIAVALVLATVSQMVLGELFPKNVAIARPYPTAMRIGLPMATANRFLRPLIVLFNRTAEWTVRRLGIEPRQELAGIRSLHELEMIVRASSAEGEIDEQETSLLTRAIAFAEKTAVDAMVPRVNVIGVLADSSVDELRQLAMTTGHSRFPVYEQDLDTVVGTVHVKDTFEVAPAERASTSVRAIAAAAEVVPASMGLDTLLVDLQRSRQTMAVVADEYGGTAGIVTVEDIVEEILGEIEDEHDDDSDEDTGTLSGALHRHEVEERSGFAWPDGNYETLNGFVTARLERFPAVGDVVAVAGFEIEVLAVDGRVADQLRIRRLPDGAS